MFEKYQKTVPLGFIDQQNDYKYLQAHSSAQHTQKKQLNELSLSLSLTLGATGYTHVSKID